MVMFQKMKSKLLQINSTTQRKVLQISLGKAAGKSWYMECFHRKSLTIQFVCNHQQNNQYLDIATSDA